MVWNIDRPQLLEALEHNGTLPRTLAPSMADGWYRVSRHAAGVAGAYAVQSKLRKDWPNIEFKVLPNNKPSVEWDAEIWARKR